MDEGKLHMKDGLFVDTCSMRDILGRYNLHASNINKMMGPPSPYHQVFSLSLTLFYSYFIKPLSCLYIIR